MKKKAKKRNRRTLRERRVELADEPMDTTDPTMPPITFEFRSQKKKK